MADIEEAEKAVSVFLKKTLSVRSVKIIRARVPARAGRPRRRSMRKAPL